MREIRPPQRHGYVDLVSYALNFADEIDCCEPQSHKEAITSKESVQWSVVMIE